MINVRFDSYGYYPALRTRQAEMRGLKEIDPDRKNKILPLLTVGEWPRAQDFERSLEAARDAMDGLPFIIDITTDQARLPNLRRKLLDGSNAFQAWRSLSDLYEEAIPVVLIPQGSRTRDIIQQAVKIEEKKGKVAFRIRDFPSETPLVIAALSALDDPTNAIIFIDCQYIRSALAAFVTASIATINAIRTEFPEAIICIMSTSFPASTVSFLDSSGRAGVVEILERDLYARIGGRPVAIYGDHSSIHSVIYDEAVTRRWSPRIDYPEYRTWHMERRPGMESHAGYVDAAQSICQMDPTIGSRNIWGESMIINAAKGTPHGKAPASWISVRVNIHISRQLDMLTGKINGDVDPEDYEEED